jgi:hypothetical protein
MRARPTTPRAFNPKAGAPSPLYLFEERSDEVHSMVVRSTADQTHLEYNNLLSLSTCEGIEYYAQLATVHAVQKIEW